MDKTKTIKYLANAVYAVGVAIFLGLGAMALFGSREYIDPSAMLPTTWRERAFWWLAMGAIPMLLACMAVYKFNDIKTSQHKKRNFTLIFLPGFVCGGCLLFIAGVVLLLMVGGFITMLHDVFGNLS